MKEKTSPGQPAVQRGEGPDPLDIHVGSRLKQRRILLGISQKQIAAVLGLTFQQIQKYERGLNRMGASRLYQMSKLLQVPIRWFFEDYPGASSPPQGNSLKPSPLHQAPRTRPKSEIFQSRETLDFIRAYYSIIDRDKRNKILTLIKSLNSKK